MGYLGTYRDVGLTKMDIVVILKSITNKALLFDTMLVARNHQSIFSYSDDLPQFLSTYNPKTYFSDYCSERISDFERRLKQRLMTGEELAAGQEVSFPRKEMTANAGRFRPRDARPVQAATQREPEADNDREQEQVRRGGRESPQARGRSQKVERPPVKRERGGRDPRTARNTTNFDRDEDREETNRRNSAERMEKTGKTKDSRSSSSSRSSSESKNKYKKRAKLSPKKRTDSQSKSKTKDRRKTSSSSSSRGSTSSNKSRFY